MLFTGVEEDGTQFLWSYPGQDTETQQPHYLEIKQGAYYFSLDDDSTRDEKDMEKREEENHFLVNTFELVEIGENKLQIDIICEYKPMLWFVLTTLEYIAEAWEESRPEIARILDSIKKGESASVNATLQLRRVHRTTVNKINKVIALREADITANKSIRGKIAICGEVVLDPKTLDRHFPELADRWDDYDFRPRSWENSENSEI